MDFIGYLKKLDSEDWNKQVTERWTVKDVTAHMVGWERKDVEEIRRIWETKSPPWWKNNPNYDEFNAKWVEFYKKYTPVTISNGICWSLDNKYMYYIDTPTHQVLIFA